MNKKLLLIVIPAILFASGCANKVHNYASSTQNTIALKKVSKDGSAVNIGEFTDSGKGETKVMCRLASPVGTPAGETFASYIKNALVNEMVIADAYDEESATIITANLNDIYGSTVLGNAYWEFDMTVNSSNGTSYDVKSRYDYESSYLATSACSEMQRSFVPAVQKLNNEIISHQSFGQLIN